MVAVSTGGMQVFRWRGTPYLTLIHRQKNRKTSLTL